MFSRSKSVAQPQLEMCVERQRYSPDAWQAYYEFAKQQTKVSHDAALIMSESPMRAGIPRRWQGEFILRVCDVSGPIAGAIACRHHGILRITHLILPSRVPDWYYRMAQSSLLGGVADLDENVSFRLPVVRYGVGATQYLSPLETVLRDAGAVTFLDMLGDRHTDYAVTTAMLRTIIN